MNPETGERTTDAVVIGAGVVGLAVARALARTGREVVVLEAEPGIGMHTSSRNSEVIHAGLHYPPGSLKARLCVAGRRALYSYAAEKGIEHRRTGKLIVATSDAERPALDGCLQRAVACGVEGVELIDAAQTRALEPEVRAVAALFSRETGIIDSHGLMAALRRDAQEAGAMVALRTRVLGGAVGGACIELRTSGGMSLRCAVAINAAGLWAQQVARSLDGVPASAVPPCHYAKGHYFSLSGRAPFRHLVYPVAVPGGLGIHLTLDLAGQARFGPDVEWVDRIDYQVDESRAPAFEAAIRRYWPALPDGALRPGYTGIRPKLGPAGSPAQDFVIQGPADHGVPGLVNLFGIESPGLTASLAIAGEVLKALGAGGGSVV
ncbi:MAG TPA: NAD(P)/FAD-dependent oxidoreductase [Myxococcales bacterium]|nr:NAD(P)/FAD-dependent oxidoreductase [Myxococcales bacterium]